MQVIEANAGLPRHDSGQVAQVVRMVSIPRRGDVWASEIGCTAYKRSSRQQTCSSNRSVVAHGSRLDISSGGGVILVRLGVCKPSLGTCRPPHHRECLPWSPSLSPWGVTIAVVVEVLRSAFIGASSCAGV